MKLIDQRASDGSRCFATLPKLAPWEVVEGHVLLLQGAETRNVVNHPMAPARLDFSYRGHRFIIHSHGSELRLLVRDPLCSDLLLYQVGVHFERLSDAPKEARAEGATQPP